MKQSILSLLLLAALPVSHAEDIRIERSYSWGSVRLSAASSETVHIGDTSLLVLRTDVLADFRFSDGRRFLVVTGRLEFDPATGDFTGTDWPFLYAARGTNNTRFAAVDEVSSVQVRGDRLKVTTTSKSYMGSEPAIMQLRRRQLAKLEEAL